MSDSLNKQISDYFAYVDEVQGAVDIAAVTDPQPTQPLQPVLRASPRMRGWVVGLAAAAVVAALVLVPLLFIAFVHEPDVADNVPETTLPPTTMPPTETTAVTTTAPEAAPTTVQETTTTSGPPDVVGQLELGGDGIGIAQFGDDEETVIAAVTAILGEPWSDTGYLPAGFDDYCGDPVPSRTVRWGDFEGSEIGGGFFDMDFVRDPIRTVAGDMTGFVSYSSSAISLAGDGSGLVAVPYPWLPGLDGLRLLDEEQVAVALNGARLSEPTRDEDDGIDPVVVSRHLDLDGPWPLTLGFWNGSLYTIRSGPCPIHMGLELDGRGIGLARFGDDPETVIAAVSRVLGPPTEDTGFVDPVALQVVGYCGGAGQRSVSWGDFSLGFVDQEYFGYVGLIAYSMSASDVSTGETVIKEDPWPVITLPMAVRLLQTEEWARTQFEGNLRPLVTTDFGDRVAWLDLAATPFTPDRAGPWPVALWFDEAGTDRITRITSTGCGE